MAGLEVQVIMGVGTGIRELCWIFSDWNLVKKFETV
jgi:hypothetical protein